MTITFEASVVTPYDNQVMKALVRYCTHNSIQIAIQKVSSDRFKFLLGAEEPELYDIYKFLLKRQVETKDATNN